MNTKEKQTKIVEVAMFQCAIYQNAINIATALMQAGRFVNVINGGTGYVVYIYERAKH